MKLRSRLLIPLLVVSALSASSPDARAEPRASDGTVLTIDSGDLVIDVGKDKGAHEGTLVDIWRPLRVRHPVTGQILTDRFRIGTVHLSQVQPTLSLAKIEGVFLRPPAAGDVVVVPEGLVKPELRPRIEPPAERGAVPTPAPALAPAPTIVPSDPDAQALADLFTSLQGADPRARAIAYDQFARARPRSRFAAVLREEIAALRAGTSEPAGAAPSRPLAEGALAAFDRARPGMPQRLAAEVDPRFVGAVAHVRSVGQATYRSLPMESLGPRYWGTTIPSDAVREPGLEYFVEGVPAEGPPVPVIGKADAPNRAEVEAPPTARRRPSALAQGNLWSEYASFNTKKANDWVFQTEGSFGWRRGDEGIRAVRSGFGVLRGKGGRLDDLDAKGLAPKDIGLTYGYIEAEIGLAESYSLIGRPILGLREDGIEGGAQGFLRIGNDLKTNLMMGGEVLGSIGLRGIVQLDWRTIPRVPIAFRSEVTNQPAGSGSDIGVRAIAQAGYEIVRDLTVSGRFSYQGRTINHAGPGAGLGASYQW